MQGRVPLRPSAHPRDRLEARWAAPAPAGFGPTCPFTPGGPMLDATLGRAA
jgi:hypothetical protein